LIALGEIAVAEKVKVAQRSQILEGSAIAVDAGGKKIAIFNAGGKLYAIDNTCLHRGGPLAEGDLDGTVVTCPWHGWEYDVTTGRSLNEPSKKVSCFELQEQGDDILIEV
jgi:nitrite reductase/ring-hydroxylating ferredoxin subunit